MSERDAMRLALHACVSLRTVLRWLANPAKVHLNTRARLETSARELGLLIQRQAA
jgi:DNA-binding LacI/PurR family transcriptional regulator